MRILIFLEDLNQTPTGIVNQRLLNGLNEAGISFHVVCNWGEKSETVSVINAPRFLSERMRKVGLIALAKDYSFIGFERQGLKEAIQICKGFQPDIILSITGGSSQHTLALGKALSLKIKIPFLIHALDAIPPPGGWNEMELYRQGVIRALKRYYPFALMYSASNPQMVKYQQEVLGLNTPGKVLYNPIVGDFDHLNETPISDSFLYLGSLYGVRKADFIIQGFKDLHADNPSARLSIVGPNQIDLDVMELPESVRKAISVLPSTSEVQRVMAEHAVLIDMDAPIEDDVFISSKLMLYLNVGRQILSITGNASAPRKFLGNNRNSISMVNHENVKQGMEAAMFKARYITSREIQNDRMDLFQKLSLKNQITQYLNVIDAIHPTK